MQQRRYLMSLYAENGRFEGFSKNSIPVYIKCEHIIDLIKSVGRIVCPENYGNELTKEIKKALRKGKLILLLDGLDQVNKNQRDNIIEQVRELVELYPKSCFLITCRMEVYVRHVRASLTELLTQKKIHEIEIEEFNDQQINNFLLRSQNNWLMPKGRSIEEFIELLNSNEYIKNLVQNPLLLTLLVFLYIHPKENVHSFDLPSSRADFYQQITSVFIEQEYHDAPIDEVNDKDVKQLILEHLARVVNEKVETYNFMGRDILEQIQKWNSKKIEVILVIS